MIKYIKNTANLKTFGIPLPLFAVMAIIVFYSVYAGVLPNNIVGGFAVIYILGAIFGEIGDRLPFWKEYIGGGAVLAFLGAAFLDYKGLLPTATVDTITFFIKKTNFLDLFIVVLIVGSVLSVNRKTLIKAITGYIPAILAGIAGALIFGLIAGTLFFGIPAKTIIMMYVMPVMGGGNGAGAIPMAQIYHSVTNRPADEYYSFAITILTIANIIAIFFGGFLNKLGKIFHYLSGDGVLARKTHFGMEDDETVSITHKDIAGGLIVAVVFYVLGYTMSKYILPSIGTVRIHYFAYIVIFVMLASVFNLIPANLKEACKTLQKFFSGQFLWVIMIGVGVAYTDLGELINAITFSNVVIAFFIVFGAVLGSGFFGHLVGFYFVESSVTAGLCMANRGGSGDLEVLGAANRMNMISFAQISSRLGGGIVLVIASVFFSIFN